jgi:hypothetical protein
VDLRTLVTYGGIWQTKGAVLQPDFIIVANYNFTNDAIYCNQERCFPDPNDVTSSWDSPGVRRGFGYAYYAVIPTSSFFGVTTLRKPNLKQKRQSATGWVV